MDSAFFNLSASERSAVLRRTNPIVSKYVEEIEASNRWLHSHMAKRPVLKSRLDAIEVKRLQSARGVLNTFAGQVLSMGKILYVSAEEMITSIDAINDRVGMDRFIADCVEQGEPHLENPTYFTYRLKMSPQDLGVRHVRDPEVVKLTVDRLKAFDEQSNAFDLPVKSERSKQDKTRTISRLSAFAKMLGGTSKAVTTEKKQLNPSRKPAVLAVIAEPVVTTVETKKDDSANHDDDIPIGTAMFGNIAICSDASEAA